MATEFSMYDRSALEQLQKSTIFRKGAKGRGGEDQRLFLKKLMEAPDEWIEKFERLHVTSEKLSPCPMTEHVLSEREFVNPPFSTEQEIATLLDGLPRNQASRPEFWTHYTIELIKNKKIEITFLAAQRSGSTSSGRDRIDCALGSENNNSDEIDGCIRTIFRNLGGVYADRAKRTSYVDCPTARAWWRHVFATEYVDNYRENADLRSASDALRGGVWEELVQAIVSRMTVVGSRNIRNMLVNYVTDRSISGKQFKSIIDSVGKRCAVQMLSILPGPILQEIFDTEIIPSARVETGN